MPENLTIQLGKAKNLNAIDVDQHINISLEKSTKDLLSYNESNVISVSDLFNTERQNSEIYRVYGTINFLSIINGLKKTYTAPKDFFTPSKIGDELSGATKNIMTCFDVYLCYPSTGNTNISGTSYVRNYVVATKLNNFEIYKAGFARNIFFNYNYSFSFNRDFSVNGYRDSFGKPVTEFYLFFNFKPTTNGSSVLESVSRKIYGGSSTIRPYSIYTSGNVLIGDKVRYVASEYEESLVERMEYYVRFFHSSGFYQFKYNPFVPIKIRDFSDVLSTGNITGGTETDFNIPSYAINIDNKGNYLWKELLANGYVDPITGKGVDHPFVNQRHYVFNNIILPLVPDLNDATTFAQFNDIKFGANSLVNFIPSSSLDSLGNKCAV
jgi:hypothetical protein